MRFVSGVAVGATAGVLFVVVWSIIAVTSDIEAGAM